MNESLEKVASYGIMPNMILYLRDEYRMSIAKGTSVIYTWTAASDILSIFGAFLSDSYLGRFLVIAIGSFSSLLVSLLSIYLFFIDRFLLLVYLEKRIIVSILHVSTEL